MQIYLPIAEVSVDLWGLLGLGAAVGFLSGVFGVGGGFLMTPLLFFMGVPPAVAVSTQANQIVASSVSGAIAHWRRGGVDFKMGWFLTLGGATGSAVGVQVFRYLRERGQFDAFVELAYVFFLGSIGALMLSESLAAGRRARAGAPPPKPRRYRWLDALPGKIRFPASGLYESWIPVVGIGFFVGLLAALLGIGGGFVIVPAMIYLLRMPTKVVVGTSLFQIVFVAAFTTVLQAAQNHTVDLVLAACLIVGGVIGAQLGVRVGQRFRADQVRAGLALIVLAVGLKLAVDLVRRPSEMFSIVPALQP